MEAVSIDPRHAVLMSDRPIIFATVFRAPPMNVPAALRTRKYLKDVLRRHGLECIDVGDSTEPQSLKNVRKRLAIHGGKR